MPPVIIVVHEPEVFTGVDCLYFFPVIPGCKHYVKSKIFYPLPSVFINEQF
jgi:hypothetical protein